jgi:hypothetical protein
LLAPGGERSSLAGDKLNGVLAEGFEAASAPDLTSAGGGSV